MRIKLLTVLLAGLCLAGNLPAGEKNWTDKAELSYVQTGGNTNIVTISAGNLLNIKFSDKLNAAWKLGVIYGESNGEKNAETYSTEATFDYLFTERLYLGLVAGWLKNELAGISSRTHIGPALGYKVLTGPAHTLDFKAGANYVIEQYTGDVEDYSYTAASARVAYLWAFSEKSTFSEALELLYDFETSDNYNLNSETALQTALSDILSLKVSYLIKYDNLPATEDLEQSDTIFSVTLVANF